MPRNFYWLCPFLPPLCPSTPSTLASTISFLLLCTHSLPHHLPLGRLSGQSLSYSASGETERETFQMLCPQARTRPGQDSCCNMDLLGSFGAMSWGPETMVSQESEDWNGMSQGTASKADFYLACSTPCPRQTWVCCLWGALTRGRDTAIMGCIWTIRVFLVFPERGSFSTPPLELL